MTIKTASAFKYAYLAANPDSHFFDRKTMRFFGDTMSNFGVRSVTIDTYDRQGLACWELYRRRPVKHGLQSSAYFTKDTFEQVTPKREWD